MIDDMLSEQAQRVLLAIRLGLRTNAKVLAPSVSELCIHEFTKELSSADLLAGIEEAERFGLVCVNRAIWCAHSGTPKRPTGLRAIISVSIGEPGVDYCDQLFSNLHRLLGPNTHEQHQQYNA